jgi:serine/threonine protein phosphatase PrpC
MCDFIKNKGNLKELSEDIVKRAIALGSRDNISVLILKL